MKVVLIILLLIKIIVVTSQKFTIDTTKFKLEHTQSLIPPFTNGSSNNWLFRGATITPQNTIELTELATCSRRSVWNKVPTVATSWKLELKYSAFNPNKKQEVADGLALWYLPPSIQQTYESSQFMYGGPSGKFTGLLIAIDTYEQRNQGNKTLPRYFNQSAIIVVYNEVPRLYDWDTEGYNITSGRCLVTNRYTNTSDTVSTLAVEYTGNTLTVYHTNSSRSPKFCLKVDNLKLPLGFNFGISATTGGFASLFQLHNFKYYSDPLSHVSQVFDNTYYNDNSKHDESNNNVLIYSLIGSITLIIITFSIIIVVLVMRSRNTSLTRNGTTVTEHSGSDNRIELKRIVVPAPVHKAHRPVPTPKPSYSNNHNNYNDDYEDVNQSTNYYDRLKFV